MLAPQHVALAYSLSSTIAAISGYMYFDLSLPDGHPLKMPDYMPDSKKMTEEDLQLTRTFCLGTSALTGLAPTIFYHFQNSPAGEPHHAALHMLLEIAAPYLFVIGGINGMGAFRRQMDQWITPEERFLGEALPSSTQWKELGLCFGVILCHLSFQWIETM